MPNTIQKEFSELTIIGLKYHYDTETFDRTLRHGISPSGESAMPVDRGASSANAYKARDEAMDSAVRMGFTPQEAIKAIRDTANFEYSEICEILGRTEFDL